MFSELLRTYYTGPEKPCTFELSSEPSFKGPLAIRTMVISQNKPLEPLVRCHHHINNDHSESKHHVVVLRDGEAKYVGTPEGKDYKNRLAMLIEMGTIDRKSISFEFKCLSSCHKITKISTALAFYFEDAVSGKILGQKIIPIHISKNYERDMRAAENAMMNKSDRKRKLPIDFNDQSHTAVNKAIMTDNSNLIQPSPEKSKKLQISIELPPERREAFKSVLQGISNALAIHMLEGNDAEREDLKLQYDEAT